MPKPKEEQQPKKEEHLGKFWKDLNILEEGESFKPSPSKKRKHKQRKEALTKENTKERKRALTKER